MEIDTKKSGNKIIIIILSLIIVGLGCFIVYDKFIKESDEKVEQKPTKPEEKEEVVDISNSQVQQLYNSVSYRINHLFIEDYFLRTNEVTVSSMPDDKKFHFALQFINMDDFSPTGTKNENGYEIYTLSKSKLDEVMKKMFGDRVTYNADTKIDYVFSFSMSSGSGATMKYDSSTDSYKTTFAGVGGITTYFPYEAKLVSATKKGNQLKLTQKVIYVNQEELNDAGEPNCTKLPNGGTSCNGIASSLRYTIYQDYEHTKLIDTKTIPATETYRAKIEDYLDQANEVVYTFEQGNNGTYHFVSSKIMK